MHCNKVAKTQPQTWSRSLGSGFLNRWSQVQVLSGMQPRLLSGLAKISQA